MRKVWCRSILTSGAIGGFMLMLAGSVFVSGDAHAQAKDAGPAKSAPAKGPTTTKAAAGKKLTPDQKKKAAGEAFNDGKAKFDAGDFQGAYEAFKLADEYLPDPPVPKFRMAECLDKMGDIEGAILAYKLFLDSKPRPDKDKDRVDAATARIAALEQTPAEVTVIVTPPEAANAARFTVGSGAPSASPVRVPPGKHTIAVTSDDFEPSSVDVDVKRGEKIEVTVNLTPKPKVDVPDQNPDQTPPDQTPPDQTPKTEEPSSSSSLIPAIVTLSLAGAGVIVGATFGGLALVSKSDYEDNPTQELFDETERNALIADMSFGVALTFGVTGLVLLLTNPGGDDESKPSAMVLPYGGPNGAGAVGIVTF